MKKFLKNLLMKHLIDIVINRGFGKIIIFSKLNTFLYLNTLNHFFSCKFSKTGDQKILTFNIFKPLFI